MADTTTKKPTLKKEVIGALADVFNKSLIQMQRMVTMDDERLRYDERAKAVFEKYGIEWN